ncbi:unnamed protein product [Clonostachys chloroleuca]|uniref:Uncharacterized protein n=1 Tax=Clonostachys chloroleuca TaxID=1926264 RepID=A0AA35Q2Z0_9HYPO|nr:unnamed protein product [Clonostachys chloroleuca]
MIAIGSITYSIAHISSHAHVLTEFGYITTIPSFQSWLVDDHLPRVARLSLQTYVCFCGLASIYCAINVQRQRLAIDTKGWNQPAGWPGKI